VSLTLTAVDVVGPTKWRWLLTDENGASLADHQVGVDVDESVDHQDSTALFGPEILKRLSDVDVIVPVTPGTAFLPGYPFEAALTGRRVTLVYALGPAAKKQGIGTALRILALYCLPTKQLPLAVRRERYELSRTLQRLASRSRRAIELQILQYGVTRDRLGDVAQQAPGWDVLHVSAHGTLGTLLLEHPDGTPDEVSTKDLVELLTPTRRTLKLVNLSVCHSGADTAAEQLRRAGLPEAVEAEGVADAERAEIAAHPPVTGLAQGLAAELDTVVLAMRDAVSDRFAAVLSAELYGQLFDKRQPVARALALALPRAVSQAPDLVASAAVPVLFGAAAGTLVLAPPAGTTTLDPAAERMAWFDPEPRTFVGRTAILATASAALRPDSGRTAVLFLGPRGIGTTSCAATATCGHR
jgi:hypothetical protein